MYGSSVTEPICVAVIGLPILPRMMSVGVSVWRKRSTNSFSNNVRCGSSPERIARLVIGDGQLAMGNWLLIAKRESGPMYLVCWSKSPPWANAPDRLSVG